ncbi:hypothetical protein DY000_02004959 [Brassica cretica]|uniref:Allantoinase n=1 Tax=Brassica cretica TaxID=69181 RepID=A0ABQ7CIN3_BRACR|nr:hypothetical protein DY000_02004959 [Brassica cretica]
MVSSLVLEAKGKGDSVTVETCSHYLAFSAEETPEGDTRSGQKKLKSNGFCSRMFDVLLPSFLSRSLPFRDLRSRYEISSLTIPGNISYVEYSLDLFEICNPVLCELGTSGHANFDDPGSSEWEGGTKADAARNQICFTDTVLVACFVSLIEAAKNRILVDVGFWGGLVPDNALNSSALSSLLDAGVLGLKSFMCPSGINDFPMTNITHIKEGLSVLAKYKRPLLVHAEVEMDSEIDDGTHNDPRSYLTYLKTRPTSW